VRTRPLHMLHEIEKSGRAISIVSVTSEPSPSLRRSMAASFFLFFLYFLSQLFLLSFSTIAFFFPSRYFSSVLFNVFALNTLLSHLYLMFSNSLFCSLSSLSLFLSLLRPSFPHCSNDQIFFIHSLRTQRSRVSVFPSAEE
jgi:hypothetical protein